MEQKYIKVMNRSIVGLYNDALKVVKSNPTMWGFMGKTLIWQVNAIEKRKMWGKMGVHVPPFAIFSVTKRCNLKCTGCYSNSFSNTYEELTKDKIFGIVEEAHELGISMILLAGGEPFVRPELLNITSEFPDIVFPVFTNGLLMKDEAISKLKRQKNVIPVLSLEGGEKETDQRRGKGVYEELTYRMEQLKSNGIFFGTSITITKENFKTVTSNDFIKKHQTLGCGLFFYIEYIPADHKAGYSPITTDQRKELLNILEEQRKKSKSLFIAFPGDEGQFGGCLSSGRGFIHIASNGSLEPCPFAPYSDTNLSETTLKDGLQSSFLKSLRDQPEHLREVEGGCALFYRKEKIADLFNTNMSESHKLIR